MANKDLDSITEIRSVYEKMESLKKAAAAAQSNLANKEKAFKKAKDRLEEARTQAKEADSEVSAFANEQKKAMQKMLGLIAKDPTLGHELLGMALNLTPVESKQPENPQLDLQQPDSNENESETEQNDE